MLRVSTALALTVNLALVSNFLAEPVQAEFLQPEGFEPDETVETLEFTIQVGEGGDRLAEPTALDLGLGFPLWLYPLASDQAENSPVGAIPQEGPEETELAPGQSATFVFRIEGEPGNDSLQRTPQLLDGVRISDIARLGIMSQGSTNWELAGYRLAINGKTFAARDDVHRRAKESIEQAQIEWIEARDALEGLIEDQEDLLALEQSGLATEEDLARLKTLREETGPLEETARWQEGVSLGIHPWFVETGLQVPGREESGEIGQASVILATAPYTNAGTYNYVYFRTGGRKYFLYPPGNHFAYEASPQSFELDLGAGPLAPGDVRGFALGLLAHNQPYAATPDRWHPQRLVVEFGGRPVYDSDSEPIDRRSLEAVRLIPPAHVDEQGSVHLNEPNPREFFVWHAGRAQGLDLENGGTAEIPGGVSDIDPEPSDTSSLIPGSPPAPGGAEGPPPDGGVAAGGVPGEVPPDGGVDASGAPGEVPPDGGVEGPDTSGQDDGCWPGEYPIEPDPFEPDPSDDLPPDGDAGGDWGGPDGVDDSGGASGPSGDWDGGSPGGGWGWWFGVGPGGIWGGAGWGPGMPGRGIPGGIFDHFPPDGAPAGAEGQAAWDLLAARLLELVDALLEALGRRDNDARPFGEPPQIDNVQLIRDAGNPRLFQVLWSVAGDESQIDHFEVSLWHVQPETEELLVADVTPEGQSTVAAGFHVSGWMEPAGVEDPAAYIQPVVVAALGDESDTSGWPLDVGAALPWLPPDATRQNQPRPHRFEISSSDSETSAWGEAGPILDQEPGEGRGGAWTAPVMPTNRDTSLETDELTSNVASRGSSDGNAEVTLRYTVEQPLESGRLYELIGHVGFLGESEDAAPAVVEARCTLHQEGESSAGDAEASTTQIEVPRAQPPQRLSLVIDPSLAPAGSDRLRIAIKIPSGSNDPAAPLAVYGLRLVPSE